MTLIVQKLKSLGRRFLDKQSRILIKNSSWVFLENLIRTVLNFTRAIIIARILGAELYGTFAMIVALCMTTQEFFNFNLGTTVVKFGAEFKADKRIDHLTIIVKGAAYLTLITAFISIIVVTFLTIFFYDTFIKKPGLSIFIIGYAIAWSTYYFDYISSSVLRLFFRFKLNSIIRIIMSVIEFIFIITALIIFKRNLTAFFFAVIFARLLNSLIINIVAYFEFKDDLKPETKFKFSELKHKWKLIRNFTINNSLSRTVFNVINQGDVLLVGILTGAVQAGYYAIAKKLAYSILRLSNPLTNAIFPQLSQLIAENKTKEIKMMIVKFVRIFSIPSIISLGVVFMFRKEIINLIFGQEYLPASDIFFVLMIVSVVMALSFWNLPLIQSIGKVGLRLITYILALIIGIVASLFLYSPFGATGIAYAVLISFLFINITFSTINFRFLNIGESDK